MRYKGTQFFLIIANTIPLFGVLFFGWDLLTILLGYWLENVVIGLINIVKMAMAQAPDPDTHLRGGGCINIPFFIVHYGIFTLAHGAFIVAFFGTEGSSGNLDDLTAYIRNRWSDIWPIVASLAVSHGISFRKHFLAEKEYENISMREQMFMPYGRVIIMHIVVLGGGFPVAHLGEPIIAFVLLIGLKVLFDTRSHIKEHTRI